MIDFPAPPMPPGASAADRAVADDPTGQWWNAAPGRIFAAYYKNLRKNYQLPASEAFITAKMAFVQYPQFMNDPINTLRQVLRGRYVEDV